MANNSDKAADAFDAVGNEYRVAILRSLMNAYQNDEGVVSFSNLFDTIEVEDSSRFNYHLQKLVGRFVRDTGDGYALTPTGRSVVSEIASGKLDSDSTLGPEPVDGECYACGEAALVLHYPGPRVRITCESCGEEVVHKYLPPAAVSGRTVEELERDFDRLNRSWRSLAADGICPECNGQIDGELSRTISPLTTPRVGDVSVWGVYSCNQCWVRGSTPPGILVLDHPATVSSYWQEGVDVSERPLWRHQWALSDEYLSVVQEDPLRVEIAVPVTDPPLRFRVDHSLDVTHVA